MACQVRFTSAVYKSPTTAYIFSFSFDEPNLFLADHYTADVARAIRSESNKTSIPQQIITTLAGIDEFAIKCGGPPVGH
jgi:hypothetical protein